MEKNGGRPALGISRSREMIVVQVIGTDRGQLTGHPSTPTISNPAFEQAWELDGLGNWTAFNDDGDSQTRAANEANEITEIIGGAVSWSKES